MVDLMPREEMSRKMREMMRTGRVPEQADVKVKVKETSMHIHMAIERC